MLRKSWIGVITMVCVHLSTTPARADMFGADVAVLIKMLAEDYKRYQQLQLMIQNARDQREFLRILNSGIDNISSLIAIMPIKDQRILEDLKTFQQAVGKVESLYGSVPKSREAALQILHIKQWPRV